MGLERNDLRQKTTGLKLLAALAIFGLSMFLQVWKLDLSQYHSSNSSQAWAPLLFDSLSIKSSGHDVAGDASFLMPTTIYNNTRDVPTMISSGPRIVNQQIAGGLYEFNNVCLTKHYTSSYLRGLVYFAPDEEELMNNELRCAPCSAPLNHPGGWNGTGRDEKNVKHKCGFECIHASYASSVDDWSDCMGQEVVQRKLKVWGQEQIPARAHTVHYYKDPVYLLNFRPENIGHSLFDTMLVWLPHWDYYRTRHNNIFPFKGLLSDSLEGCLTTNDSFWFCEILRAVEAFGMNPIELPPKPNNTTLYCYESLYISHLAAQRQMRYPQWLPKRVFDSFRDVLFEEFKLPRSRSYKIGNNIQEGSASQNANSTKRILFYAHEPSGRRVWNGMNDLIHNAKGQPKYSNLQFDIIHDFNIPITEQAKLFNAADAHVMVHGAQMANSIFSVDGTFFVEIGCRIPVFIGNQGFLNLIDGNYMSVQQCLGKSNVPCLVCEGNDLTYGNFTMTSDSFERLMDQVVVHVNG
jgi:hypothetical protein